jgi:hypothetical protein
VWRPLGSWSGRALLQTDAFISDTGLLRVTWKARDDASTERGTLRISLHSDVSGRLLSNVVEHRGAGADVAYVNEDPRAFFLVIESKNLEWSVEVAEGLAGESVAVKPSGNGQETKPDLLSRVDHLVYAAPNLEQAIKSVEALLGVEATPGGQHPGRGTRNALISLGGRTYIEIIGPDPEQPNPKDRRPFGIDSLTEARLVTWAASETDLKNRADRARQAGVTLGDLAEGSRKRPDGGLLTWRYTDPRVVVSEGVVPFFIDWGKTPHPAESAVSGGRLVGLRAEHPDAERVQRELRSLGLDLTVTKGPRPALVATIEGPRRRVELR